MVHSVGRNFGKVWKVDLLETQYGIQRKHRSWVRNTHFATRPVAQSL